MGPAGGFLQAGVRGRVVVPAQVVPAQVQVRRSRSWAFPRVGVPAGGLWHAFFIVFVIWYF